MLHVEVMYHFNEQVDFKISSKLIQASKGYPSKHVCLHEMFHKEKYLSLEKVIPMDKFANHCKMVF